MSPSEIPVWGWFLAAAASGGFFLACFNSKGSSGAEQAWTSLLSVVFALAGILCGVIGVIRFAKWVWVG